MDQKLVKCQRKLNVFEVPAGLLALVAAAAFSDVLKYSCKNGFDNCLDEKNKIKTLKRYLLSNQYPLKYSQLKREILKGEYQANIKEYQNAFYDNLTLKRR